MTVVYQYHEPTGQVKRVEYRAAYGGVLPGDLTAHGESAFDKLGRLKSIDWRAVPPRLLNRYECFIDATFSKAKGGGDGVGLTKAGKGVKIMVLVDARGLPVAVDCASATPHESRLVKDLFEFMLTDDTPERVIGDKAYDSDTLDDQLACQGTDLIAPHRKSRRPENATQDGRYLRRYRRRWTVERTIAWFQNYRRLCIRWEKSATLFQGFLHLSCSLMLLRQVLG